MQSNDIINAPMAPVQPTVSGSDSIKHQMNRAIWVMAQLEQFANGGVAASIHPVIASPSTSPQKGATRSSVPRDMVHPDALIGMDSNRRALAALLDFDGREEWQRSLVEEILCNANPDPKYDPFDDDRMDGIIDGLNLYFRFYELRPNGEYRHCPERFHPDGFMEIDGEFEYPDHWWDSVNRMDLKIAEDVLKEAGVLEFKEIKVEGYPYLCIRLRCDRIMEILAARRKRLSSNSDDDETLFHC